MINTTAPLNASALRSANIDFPINRALVTRGTSLVDGVRGQAAEMQFVIARRDVGATTTAFEAMANGTWIRAAGGKARVQSVSRLDGEYVVLLATSAAAQKSESKATTNSAAKVRRGSSIAAFIVLLVCVVL